MSEARERKASPAPTLSITCLAKASHFKNFLLFLSNRIAPSLPCVTIKFLYYLILIIFLLNF